MLKMMNLMIETTGFIAGWSKHNRVQETYVKEAIKRTMVASRVTVGKKVKLKSAVIDKSIVDNPETFHRIQLSPVK